MQGTNKITFNQMTMREIVEYYLINKMFSADATGFKCTLIESDCNTNTFIITLEAGDK